MYRLTSVFGLFTPKLRRTSNSGDWGWRSRTTSKKRDWRETSHLYQFTEHRFRLGINQSHNVQFGRLRLGSKHYSRSNSPFMISKV
jgi:hypothetical protein